jgi:hypothetical protein
MRTRDSRPTCACDPLRTEVAHAPQRLAPAQFLCYVALSSPRRQYPPTALSDYDFRTAKRRHYSPHHLVHRKRHLFDSKLHTSTFTKTGTHLSPFSILALTTCRRCSFQCIDPTDSDSVAIKSCKTGRGLDHNVLFSTPTTALSRLPLRTRPPF